MSSHDVSRVLHEVRTKISIHQETLVKTSPLYRIGHLGFRKRRHAHAKLISRCKIYGAYLTGDSELYGAYLTYHAGKVRQVSGSVVCMRFKLPDL